MAEHNAVFYYCHSYIDPVAVPALSHRTPRCDRTTTTSPNAVYKVLTRFMISGG